MNAYGLSLENLICFALGGIGLWMLLPRGKEGDIGPIRYFGALLCTAALVFLSQSLALPFPKSQLTNAIAFYVMAAVSLISAVLMITNRNPVHCALWFALVLLSNSGLYLLTGAEFLAAATIIIYAGAIIVTFLFVIMLAQPRGTAQYDHYSREPFMSCLAGLLLAWTLTGTIFFVTTREVKSPVDRMASISPHEHVFPLMPTHGARAAILNRHGETLQILDPRTRSHMDGFGRALFLNHYVSIEVIGVILLIAVVGALLIATLGHPKTKPSPEPQPRS